MLKTKFSFPSAGSIEATLEITMTISEWQALKAQLNKEYPGWNLTPAIRTLVEKATTNFSSVVEANHE